MGRPPHTQGAAPDAPPCHSPAQDLKVRLPYYAAMLRHDPKLTEQRAGRPVPAQLPASPRWFTGRTGELAELTKALGSGTEHAGVVPIATLVGTGGIGKPMAKL